MTTNKTGALGVFFINKGILKDHKGKDISPFKRYTVTISKGKTLIKLVIK